MQNLKCEFSGPVMFDGNPPATSSDIWEFSEVVCQTTSTELIQATSTGAEFWIDKSLSYGDVLVLTFLLLFAVFGTLKAIADYFLPRRISKY